ncbi:MAG: membrane protein insertion efficiency factor YidD [Alphaproteobacteria bacterium]|nr:membrane protein insertion efficiency factor YidD [Alphaproteobacteria bacterium]
MGIAMARIFQYAILVYQVCISPLFPAPCRYWPTCSVYAAHAVRDRGALAGVLLALRRIARCHPWGGWGYDPVPAPQKTHKHSGACTHDVEPRHPESGQLEHGVAASLEHRS